MKKHTKAALIVASCLSIGATFLMIHPSQAFFLDLPQQKNGIRQDTDKQMNQPGKDVQDIRIIKEETPDKQDKADEKKNPAPDNTLKEKSKEKQMPKKDSMKKTPENNKKDMPDTQSKVPPVEGNIPPAVQKSGKPLNENYQKPCNSFRDRAYNFYRSLFPLRQHSCGGRTTANAGLPTLSVPIRGICCPGKEDLFPKARVSLYKEV